MSDGDKLLTDMKFGDAKTEMQKTDVPLELPEDDERESGSESETESKSDTDNESCSDSDYKCSICDKKFSGYKPLKQHEKGKKHAKMVSKKKLEEKLAKEDKEVGSDDEQLISEPYAVCRTCDKEFSGPQSYNMHLKCKTHRHKVLEGSILQQVRDKGEINEKKLKELYKNRKLLEDKGKFVMGIGNDENSQEEFECKECEKVFSGFTPFSQHLLSKTHAKQREKTKLMHKVVPETDDAASDKSKGDLSALSLEDDVLVCKLCSTSFTGPESALMHMKSKNHSKHLEKYSRKIEKKKAKKEAKHSVLSSKKELKDLPEKEQGEQQEDCGSSNKSDAPDNLAAGETEILPASSDKAELAYGDHDKFKKCKDLMHSLQAEDA